MGTVGVCWEQLGFVGNSWGVMGTVGVCWEQLGFVGNSWGVMGTVGAYSAVWVMLMTVKKAVVKDLAAIWPDRHLSEK